MYRRTAFAFLLTLVACGASAACKGSSSPNGPSTSSVSGTWTGSITSNQAAGSGPARVTLSQTGNNLSGTWSVTGPNSPDSGSLTGSINGSGSLFDALAECPDELPLYRDGDRLREQHERHLRGVQLHARRRRRSRAHEAVTEGRSRAGRATKRGGPPFLSLRRVKTS